MSYIKLSIVIVAYKCREDLRRCLDSIKEHLNNLSYEVCVIDNASLDGTVELMKESYPEHKLVVNYQNMGFAKGVNQGMRETTGEYVLWLNPDAVFLDGNIEKLLEVFEKDPKVGVIGPQILNPDKTVQLSCRSFPGYENYFFNRYSLLTKLFPNNPLSKKYLKANWDHKLACEIDWVSGAAFFHRRSLLSEIGWLDEGFFMYMEEVDFCKRAYKQGWRVYYEPSCQVSHEIAGSSAKVPLKVIVIRHQSIWRYYTKHFKRNKIKDFIVSVGLILRASLKIIQSFFSKEKMS